MWRKESQPKPVGIERSSPDGHRQQRPRAIVRLHVHLRLGREKQLDHLREAVACRRVQRGPASVRSPACGCASGHLPYKARYQVVGVDVCYKAFFIRCMFDRIGQSPHLRSLYQVYHISFITYNALMRHTDTACRESRFKPVECVQVLSSERKAIGNTWQNPV